MSTITCHHTLLLLHFLLPVAQGKGQLPLFMYFSAGPNDDNADIIYKVQYIAFLSDPKNLVEGETIISAIPTGSVELVILNESHRKIHQRCPVLVSFTNFRCIYECHVRAVVPNLQGRKLLLTSPFG